MFQTSLRLEHSDTVRDFGAGIKKFTAMEVGHSISHLISQVNRTFETVCLDSKS